MTHGDRKLLPRTAAVNPGEYLEYFKNGPTGVSGYTREYRLGISSSYQNACVAAADLPEWFSDRSQNLSTGIGL